MKKKYLLVIMTAILMVMMSGCESGNQEEHAMEEYRSGILKEMQVLGVTVDASDIDAAENDPRYTSAVKLDSTDQMISVDALQNLIYAYEVVNGEQIDSSAKDMAALYNEKNETIEEDFNRLYRWMGDTRRYLTAWDYGVFCEGVYELYSETEGSAFAGRDFSELTAEEKYQLALWGLEKDHYSEDWINEIISSGAGIDPNETSESISDTDTALRHRYFYVRFLYNLGRITRDGEIIK
jgi:hypothetical protein